MILEKIITFTVMYSLTSTPAAAANLSKKDVHAFSQSGIQEKVHINEHYADRLVATGMNKLKNPIGALGKPDAKLGSDKGYALIPPGEEIILIMEKPFSALRFGGINGRVITNGDCNYEVGYEVLTEGPDGKPVNVWRWALPTNVPGGIYIQVMPANPEKPGSDGDFESVKIKKIKIRNIDTKPLYLDAVINY
ncbi:hypothetical protein AYK26_05335 [Euryarchaeota archaeon SM23-78]|nr:MAG: hypothetical protein AYK26_05335 [Euryarchaeota archaeon SM23-78]MBW3000969.1 hypothetical protein [Candidatus Woesearchaeota archaeon]